MADVRSGEALRLVRAPGPRGRWVVPHTAICWAGLGGTCAVLVLWAAPAGAGVAHTALEGSSPAAGARVGAAPGQVTLDFTGPIRARLGRVSVRGPGGERFESGAPQVGKDKVWQPLKPLGAAGRYEISYRVVARDGHALTGTIRFTLTRPGSAAAASALPGLPPAPIGQPRERAAPARDEVPAWALAAFAVLAVGAVAGAVGFGRRVTRDID